MLYHMWYVYVHMICVLSLLSDMWVKKEGDLYSKVFGYFIYKIKWKYCFYVGNTTDAFVHLDFLFFCLHLRWFSLYAWIFNSIHNKKLIIINWILSFIINNWFS